MLPLSINKLYSVPALRIMDTPNFYPQVWHLTYMARMTGVASQSMTFAWHATISDPESTRSRLTQIQPTRSKLEIWRAHHIRSAVYLILQHAILFPVGSSINETCHTLSYFASVHKLSPGIAIVNLSGKPRAFELQIVKSLHRSELLP